MIDERTAHFSLPLPAPGNRLEEDVVRLRNTIINLDGLVHWAQQRVESDDPVLNTLQAVVDALKVLHAVATSGSYVDLEGKPTLGTAAATDSAAYATAAQGLLAASALQDSDIDVRVQAYDAELAALAALASDADKLPYFSGPGVAALATLTAAGRALIGVANAAAQRDVLGLTIGTHVQGFDESTTKNNAANTFTQKQTFSKGVKEGVHTLSGTSPSISAANGSIQTWALTGNSSPTDALESGDSVTLMIDDGASHAITWPSMKWVGGDAPELVTTGDNIIELWKVGSQLFGAYVGVA